MIGLKTISVIIAIIFLAISLFVEPVSGLFRSLAIVFLGLTLLWTFLHYSEIFSSCR